MAWIESHDDIWDHPKTLKLCEALGISDVQAVGHLISLWHFILRNAWKTASLEPWGDRGVERAARWGGSPGAMVKALRSSGYLDGFDAHGWLERAGKLVNDRFYNEERRKNGVIRRKSEATLPNPTLPNPTLPTDICGSKFQVPKPKEVDEYAQSINFKIDGSHFCDYYETRGWMMGKTKMKSWKAAVRTWRRNGNQNQQGRIVGGAAAIPGKYDHLG